MFNDEMPQKSDRMNNREVAQRALVAGLTSLVPGIGGALQSVSMDMLERQLSAKELSRVERTIIGAANLIDERMRRGHEPRVDGFANATPVGRSFAEEVAEGVLLAVQKENEESKLPFYQALIANYVFNPGLEPASARTMLSLASDLSYRQFCVMGAIARDGRFKMSVHGDQRLRIMQDTPRSSERIAYWGNTLKHELDDLGARGLVETSQGVPMLLYPTSLGKLFADALELRNITVAEIDSLIQLATQDWG